MVYLERCPVCNEPTGNTKKLLEQSLSMKQVTLCIHLVECISCKHVFLNPQPTWGDLKDHYELGREMYDNERDIIIKKIEKISDPEKVCEFNHIPITRGGRFLDIGCSIGNIVYAMSVLGMESEGVEPSLTAVNKAKNLGRKVFHGELYDIKYPDATFDAISMFHVLEHVGDPLMLLRECHRILKAGGTVSIGVPNFDSLVFRFLGWEWSGMKLPTHFHHFRISTLARLSSLAGFSAVKIFTESLPTSVEGELAFWIRKHFFIPQCLSLKTRILFPLAAYISSIGNKTGKGEAIVALLRKNK